ncbi:GNAT family N-acetyltransferase [Paracoccaceae bacterium GXU_MW_L88]
MSRDWREGAPPYASDYNALRKITGLGAKSDEAVRRGLKGGLHAVACYENGQIIAMGRVIGDGGCFVHITDIAVHPDHQRQGLGRAVMDRLMRWCRAELPASCYLSLIADPGAEKLYESVGFVRRTGMGMRL